MRAQCFCIILGVHIRPEGWKNWGKASNEVIAYYAEFGSTDPGVSPQRRVRQLTAKEAQ